ncbi:hypothetical protein LAZ67_6003839 [Cordylochernes scorpioides]|uniref:Reverse transcriptase n=1 Tax=Cordylochernes scorpioides TaxID=51811 RepID=A0ABY6KLI8_9ARAC|nr:hypothetical protein LAZ67_6003839 [Cordylochernes scorpioides]
MYTDSSTSIRTPLRATSPIPFKRGVKQGCPGSPTLFNVAIVVIGQSLIEGNELADKLAKEGCWSGRDVVTPIPKKEVFKRIRAHINGLWKDRSVEAINGRKAFKWIGDPKRNGRILSHKLNRMITGYGPFPLSLARFGIKTDDRCICGSPGANAKHFIVDCPRVPRGEEESRRVRGAIELELLKSHWKLLERAHDDASELFLNC